MTTIGERDGRSRTPGGTGSTDPRWVRLAGGLLVLAALGYLVIEAVVAAAWIDPPYDYLANLVPSLGSTACGPSNGQLVCSPRHDLMNAMFVGHGLLFAVAGVVLSRLLTGRRRTLMVVLSVLYAVGLSMITVFHHYAGMPVTVRVLNISGAFLAIIAGGLLAILAGRTARRLRIPRWAAWTSVVLGIVAVGAGIVFFALSIGPLGVRERVSIYPLLLWQLVAGMVLLRTWSGSRASSRQR